MSQLMRTMLMHWAVTYWHQTAYNPATGAATFAAPVVLRASWDSSNELVFKPDGSAATNAVVVVTEGRAWPDGTTTVVTPALGGWVAFGEFTAANPASVPGAVRVLHAGFATDKLAALDGSDQVQDWILKAGM